MQLTLIVIIAIYVTLCTVIMAIASFFAGKRLKDMRERENRLRSVQREFEREYERYNH